jgi:type VI secretion system protein ImpJ
MSWRSRVVWSSGMFLQPHHFQQETRYLERLVDARSRSGSPYAWGYSSLQLDEGLLALGRIGLVRASGVLPDGTPFAAPQVDPLPDAIEVPQEITGEEIVLALPAAREGSNEFDLGLDALDAGTRFDAVAEEVRDSTHAAEEPVTIQLGRPRLRLMRAREAASGFSSLAVARVVERRPDGQLVLDRQHIPPVYSLDASPHLASEAHRLHGLIADRAKLLASRMGQLGHGVSELADFLMLQTLNRNEPVFAQHAASPVAHPRELLGDCLRLAGDLATLSSAQRRPPAFPAYRHDQLQGCFTPVFDLLRSLLSAVLESNAVPIELVERKHGVRTAVVADLDLVRNAGFVLAVSAQLPAERLRVDFPAKTKVGPVDRIKDLVNYQFPGIGLRALPVAPRQLPYHAGCSYFELDKGSELWRQVEANGTFAMHVPDGFPGLELEFWAIRK